jgi:hypothetical protein
MKMHKFLILSVFIIIILPAISWAETSTGVDLMWQGDGYVPPFYEARTLWGNQTGITFLAIPYGFDSTTDLYYKWYLDEDPIGTESGIGRNTFRFADSILSKPRQISVELMRNKEVVASATEVVSPTSPQILVYENSPLYGYLFNNEIGEVYNMTEPESTFAAFPLLFKTTDKSSGVSYVWSTNSGEGSRSNSVTYRSPSTSGSSRVSVSATSINNPLQSAGRSFTVNFASK